MGSGCCKGCCGGAELALGPNAPRSEIKVTIQSYMKGLKSRLRDSMEQYNLVGTVQKTVLEAGEGIKDNSNPIYTLINARGKTFDVSSFSGVIDDIVDDGVDVDRDIKDIVPPSEDPTNMALVLESPELLMVRKSSDGGDNPEERKVASVAAKAKGQIADKARAMMATLSKVPGLSDYTDGMEEKWSIKIKEAPKELVTATSLFHPFGTYSFPLYPDDGPSILIACLQWRLKIPSDSLELYTLNGVPLNDVDTLQKEKQAIYVDSRVTASFFAAETERPLLKLIEAISSEPFMLHKMALHKMTVEWLKQTLLPMSEEMAIGILKEDLNVSSVIAIRLLTMIKAIQ